MSISISVGVSNHEDSFKAGYQASDFALHRLGRSPKLAIVFASIHFDQDKVIQGVSNVIDKKMIIGTSSYAEISNLGVTRKSVVIFLCAMDDVSLQLNHTRLQGIQEKIVNKLLSPMNLHTLNPDLNHSLGLLFRTAGEPVENGLIEGIQENFPRMILFGGMGSGDFDRGIHDSNYWKSYLYIDGQKQEKSAQLMHLALLKSKYRPGFAFEHGWSHIGNVVELTRCENNKVFEIDHMPIIDFYRQFLCNDSDDILRKTIHYYGLGVQLSECHASIVKIPSIVNLERGYIQYFPYDNLQGKKARLIQANRTDIIEGAKNAAIRCKNALGDYQPAFVLVISCCMRGNILNSRMNEEFKVIEGVFGKGVPIFGYYSGGELAPYMSRCEDVIDDTLQFSGSAYHATTIAMMALGCKSDISVALPDQKDFINPNNDIDDYKRLLDQCENKLDDTRQFMISMSRKNIEQSEQLAAQNDQLSSKNEELQSTLHTLDEKNKTLNLRNQFIQKTFGRYLSDQVVAQILETPEGLNLGGEKRNVTLMMTDIRGFTSMCERLEPEDVMTVINNYLGIMTTIILSYNGSINEFIGDAIMAIFGAPIGYADHAERAVACAIEMQTAMKDVNEKNKKFNLPELEMGIGLNTTHVVVGNIGSEKRAKYGVVGSGVNLTSRIESYTTGGQILISSTTKDAVKDKLLINGQMNILPKGVDTPITIYEVIGISGLYHLFLPEKNEMPMVTVKSSLLCRFLIIHGKDAAGVMTHGLVNALSIQKMSIHSEVKPEKFSNMKCQLFRQKETRIPGELYGKVVDYTSDGFIVHFTSISTELNAFINGLLVAFS